MLQLFLGMESRAALFLFDGFIFDSCILMWTEILTGLSALLLIFALYWVECAFFFGPFSPLKELWEFRRHAFILDV